MQNITHPPPRPARINKSGMIENGELDHACKQLATLSEAGLPIPHHLQEWLKQNVPNMVFEMLACRRIIEEDSAPLERTVVPFKPASEVSQDALQ